MTQQLSASIVSAYSFQTIYGSNQFTIVPQGSVIAEGDNFVLLFRIFRNTEPAPLCTAKLKITRSLWPTWGMDQRSVNDVDTLLYKLGQAAISIALLKGEIADKPTDVSFNTYNSSEAPELQIYLLEKERDSLISRQAAYLKQVQTSFESGQKLDLEFAKDYIDFKQKNATEIRAIILQLSSVSAVIVAGILTLNPSGLNEYVIASLVLLIGVGFAPLYIFHLLENLDIGTFNALRKSQERLSVTKKKEMEFLDAPSPKAAEALNEEYQQQYDDLKGNLIQRVNRDKIAWFIQILFGIALLLLGVGYVSENLRTKKGPLHGDKKIDQTTSEALDRVSTHNGQPKKP